jgi:small subunit ribosomal protein S20
MSQIKRNRQNDKRRLTNRVYRGEARLAVKNARNAFDTSAPGSKEELLKAISALDKAVEKGVLHKNNAARRKSRLMKAFAAMKPAEVKAAVEEPKAEAAPVAEPKTRRTTRAKAVEKVEAPAEKTEPKKKTTTASKKVAAAKKPVKSTTTKAPAKKPAAPKKTTAKK